MVRPRGGRKGKDDESLLHKVTSETKVKGSFYTRQWAKGLGFILVLFVVISWITGMRTNTIPQKETKYQSSEVQKKEKPAGEAEFEHLYSIRTIRKALGNGKSCLELTRHFLERIAQLDLTTKAVVELRSEKDIINDANLVDFEQRLACVPVIVKDNIPVKNMVTGSGSVVLANKLGLSTFDSQSVIALKKAGAIILGHGNMDELALSFKTLSSRGGQTRNIFDLSRYPGGSSGGTSVAVAAGFAVLGIGTDTGGSVRIPAQFAGLVGLRPTFGGISTEGVVPLSHSRDTVGLMAFTSHDVEAAYEVSTGKHCPRQTKVARRYRIGVLRNWFPAKGTPQESLLTQAIVKLSKTVDFVDIPSEEDVVVHANMLSKYKSTSAYEFEGDLGNFFKDTSLEGTRLLELAKLTLSNCKQSPRECESIAKSIKKKALKEGRLSKKQKKDLDRLLQDIPKTLQRATIGTLGKYKLDAFMYPTFKHEPSFISQGTQKYCGNNRLAPALGWPALTLPIGFYSPGPSLAHLPQNAELLSRAGSECLLFEVAAHVQKKLKLERPSPSIFN